MQRTTRLGSALLSLALVFGAQPPMAMAEPNSATAQINWSSCSGFLGDVTDLATAQCALVDVPLSYADPTGPQVQVGVIRIPASGKRIGSLFVNPGGPGASAVDSVAGMGVALAGSPINESFDLVGVDPRGVGYSQPQLRCRTDAEFDDWRREPMVDFSPAGVAHIEAIYQQYAQRCAQRMGPAFLASVGTREAARDLDLVRGLLGDEQLNYLGFSYGTSIGTEYLQQYPDRVRAMVLDGAIDPTVDPISSSVNQMAGFQTVFDDYAADCTASAGCPLGQDPDQAVARYRALVDPLAVRPAATTDPRGLSYADANTGTFNALYTQYFWKFLTSGLLGLARGTDPGDLLLLADEYQGRRPDGRYRNVQDAFNAVRCVDAAAPTDAATWVEADRRTREAAPFAAYGQFTGYAPRDICAFWPVPATSGAYRANPVSHGKAVVVSTTHDPATPYQAGVSLAQQLAAPLLTFEGSQHTVVFNGYQCVDTTIVNYLIDGVVPGDMRC